MNENVWDIGLQSKQSKNSMFSIVSVVSMVSMFSPINPRITQWLTTRVTIFVYNSESNSINCMSTPLRPSPLLSISVTKYLSHTFEKKLSKKLFEKRHNFWEKSSWRVRLGTELSPLRDFEPNFEPNSCFTIFWHFVDYFVLK